MGARIFSWNLPVDWSENLSAGSLIEVSQPGHTGYSANNFATTNSEVSPAPAPEKQLLILRLSQACTLILCQTEGQKLYQHCIQNQRCLPSIDAETH
jgi:hypothetical protein